MDRIVIDRRSKKEREMCPICECPYPDFNHPSFQWCVPYLIARIRQLEYNTDTRPDSLYYDDINHKGSR